METFFVFKVSFVIFALNLRERERKNITKS